MESQDGLNWQKPELADSLFGGYPVTNVVRINDARGTRIQAPWVFHNLTTDDSAKAYAMIYNSVGLRLAYSPDGLIWTPASEEALFNYHSDTHNYVVWNQQLSMWMLYMRPPIFFHEGPGILLLPAPDSCQCADLLDWTVLRTVLYPDELDLPDFDGAHVFPYRGPVHRIDHALKPRGWW